jgi:hypothetical protein
MVEKVVSGLQSLWYAPTKREFESAREKFLAECYKHVPAYVFYFESNWLEHFHCETWASFGCPSDAPSGNVPSLVAASLIFTPNLLPWFSIH